MTVPLFVMSIIVGVYLSLFLDTSNAEFFQKYGLLQSAHLDANSVEKLQRRYAECIAKFNSLDSNVHADQIPTNMDIPSHSGFLELKIDNLFKNVKLWPNNKIPTELDQSVYIASFEERLACAVSYFHLKTCIRFIKKKKHHKNYLYISNNGVDCSSEEVGMKGGKQMVIFDGSTDCMRHGTIVHELMHVIGLFHEHQRHDRDEHIDVIHDNIPPSIIKQFQTIEQMGYQNYDDIGKYDFSSIMHYGSKFGNDRVMIAKYSKYIDKAYDYTEQMGNRKLPTDTDTSKANGLYQCDSSTTTTTTTTSSSSTKKPVTSLSPKILLICGHGGKKRISSMEYYLPYQSQYNSLIDVAMIRRRGGHTSVVMNDGKIMTIGGIIKAGVIRALKDVEIFDPITNKSTKGANMNTAREDSDSAIINGIVYVCGGSDRKNHLSSCESYQSGVWKYISSMHKVHTQFRLISLNGYLFAIGGGMDGSRNSINSVERYNPNSNSWIMVKSMQNARRGHGAAVLNGFIYVCEGWKKHSCERYDPTLNKWLYVTQTTIYRGSGLKMVSDGQQLFAFAGFFYDAWHSVEMYNPKKDKWTKLNTPIHKRWRFSAVVLS